MITEDYVSFETAKLLKEKGFCENCRTGYVPDTGTFINGIPIGNDSIHVVNIPAPTQALAMKWLMENHNLFIQPLAGVTGGKWWYDFDIIPVNGRDIKWDYYMEMSGEYGSPEEAIEAAIKYCLENLV